MKALIFTLASLVSISLSPAEELQALLEQGKFTQVTSTYGSTKTNQARFTKSICTLAISFFHQLSLPVIEPERLKSSRQHLLNMASNSREMWKAILAETDDQREWLPSPKQKSVIGVPITEKMVTDWEKFLSEWEAILEGKKLIPHWRFPGKGINLKRAFEESKHTDLILWITGEAAAHYIEVGETTDADFWNQLNETFGQNFLPMSFWIN